jgi:hypothetical protein
LIKIAIVGKLPNFTWLQPQSTTYGQSLCNWQHPDASVIEGKTLLQLLSARGTVWWDREQEQSQHDHRPVI